MGRVAWVAPALALAFACGEREHPPTNASDGGAFGTNAGATSATAASGDAGQGGARHDEEPSPGGAGSAESYAACFPFELPARGRLGASTKHAFAYYLPEFPLSFENAEPDADGWEELLTPSAAFGSEVRDRPLPRPPRDDEDWQARDAELEIRQAVAAGLDGWVMALPRKDEPAFGRLQTMLDAASRVAPEFRIVLSPHAPDSIEESNAGIVAALEPLVEHPALLRTSDDALVLAPFFPETRLLSFWDGIRSQLAVRSVYVPIFVAYRGYDHEEFTGLVQGFSSWAARNVAGTAGYSTASDSAHALDKLWMQPVALEEVRFSRGMQYWEGENTELLRASLRHAIEDEADWLLLTAWNDYSSSWLAPSRARGYAPLDVAAYYVTWFKTGEAPAITRDALYYSHRSHPSAAPFDEALQTAGAIKLAGDAPAADEVELLAFLTAPATLRIRQGEHEASLDVEKAGIALLRAPLEVGQAPSFELERDGEVTQRVVSDTPVTDSVTYQELIYHSGGGLDCERPK